MVPEAEALIAHPPEEFRERRGIDLRLDTPIAAIDLDGRDVVTVGGERIGFDRLVVASGATPIVPAIPGVDDKRVVTIRRLDDAITLRSKLTGVRRAVIVGAGYVGLEMAESLREHGIEVTIVDRLPRVMATLDEDIAALVEQEVRRARRAAARLPAGGNPAAGRPTHRRAERTNSGRRPRRARARGAARYRAARR